LRFNQDDFSELDGAERQFDTSNIPYVTAQILFGSGRMLITARSGFLYANRLNAELPQEGVIEWPRVK
jgi:hypothetical protein